MVITISDKIRILREKKYPGRGGATVCAEEFGVGRQQWYDWESGKATPGARNQQKLADFFDLTLAELRCEKIKMPPAQADDITKIDKEFIAHCLNIQKGIAELVVQYLSLDEEGKKAIRAQVSQCSQALLDRLESAEG